MKLVKAVLVLACVVGTTLAGHAPAPNPSACLRLVKNDDGDSGYCRHIDNGKVTKGEYRKVCKESNKCSLSECEEKCFGQEKCRGIEWNDGQCELHWTKIHNVEGHHTAKCWENVCYEEYTPAPTPFPVHTPPPDHECFEWVGKGYCRHKDWNGNLESGDFTKVCTSSKPCTLHKCWEKCNEAKDCEGVEFNDGSCELHWSSVDDIKEHHKADCWRHICKPQTCFHVVEQNGKSGFCRHRDPHSGELTPGKYEEVCNGKDKWCSKEACKEHCRKRGSHCKAIEWRKGVCEIHEKVIHTVKKDKWAECYKFHCLDL